VFGLAAARTPGPGREAAARAGSGASAPAASQAEASGAPDPTVAATVERVIESARHPWIRWPDLEDVAPALRELYGAEADRLFWFSRERPHPALAGAISAVAGASDHALDPADYDCGRLEAEWRRLQAAPALSGADRALFDLAVSIAVLREIGAVHRGRVDPRTLGWGYDLGPRELDRALMLREARNGEGIPRLLDNLEPADPHFVRLRQALARYRALAREGEPGPVPALPKGRRKIEPGQAWDGLTAVRRRLVRVGDLASGAARATARDGTPRYAGPIVDAVKRFQTRHVLAADGVLDAETIGTLEVPLAARVRQIELAMERGRWLPRLAGRPAIFVNIPLFRLWATDPARPGGPVSMKVVVGKSLDNQTPVFVQQMEYVIFRPYWNPPYDIATKEIVPRARQDPSYLERENFEIVASGDDDAPALPATSADLDAVVAGRLFVRQRPGPKNSLGLVKFIFPNHEDVYMHGTPATELFSRTRRDFSHGCIRVEDPERLAEWVLRDVPGWTRERIEAAMRTGGPTRVDLKQPLTVVLFYDTVRVDAKGVVYFAPDIYGHDRTLDETLRRGYPYPEQRPPESGAEGRDRGRW
jgi:murein L,D-transpeptidase YcbB/YkuD